MVSNNSSACFTHTKPWAVSHHKTKTSETLVQNKQTKWTKYLDQIDEIIFVKCRC